MEKFFLLLIISLFSFAAQAQEAKAPKNQYSIEIIKPDSIFLNEKVFEISKSSPRPDAKINSRFFKSIDEITALVKQLREQAENFNKIADQVEVELAKSKAVKQ